MPLPATVHESPLLLGCWRLHARSSGDIERLIATALEIGITQFDHADIYGNGESERCFAKAIGTLGIARERLQLQSKCGIRDGFYDSSKEHLLTAVDGILKRLGTDYLDTLLIHRPDALMQPEEIAEAFDALYSAGKVRRFGVSNFRSLALQRLQKATAQKLAINQLQFGLAHSAMVDSGLNANTGFHGAIDRDGELLDYCQLNSVRIQAWSPLQFGFFEGNFLGHAKYPELNHALNNMAQIYGSQAGAVAIAWILRHPAGMHVVLGTTNAQRLQALGQATQIRLSREHWYQLYRAAGNRLP